MLWGCLCVAVDGTLCERKRGSGLSDREKRRYALEARIITPWGWNIPLLTEAVEASEDGGRYDGAFATSFEVSDAKRALVVAAWGRRRWNVETGFRVEKHGGFGLEHTFCNDDTAGRNYHVLMQIAYTLWQVFDTGVLSRLSEGCRKPSQEMWAKMLFVAILVLGLASVPRVAVGAMRMRRYHLVA